MSRFVIAAVVLLVSSSATVWMGDIERREWKPSSALSASVLPTTSESGGIETLPPPGVKPFEQPIALRFRPINHFTYSWEKRWTIGSVRDRLMEGFVLEGAVKARADLLSWNYTVSNIGHDGKLHEWGRVEAVTDVWGEVREVKILSRNVPNGAPARRAGLDESQFEFPLCCLPRAPVRMGDDFVDWQEAYGHGGESGIPGNAFANFDMRSVVTGVVTEESRKYLVVEHRGGLTSDAEGAQGRMSVAGYWLIDLSNGLKSRGIMRKTIAVDEHGQASRIVSSDTVRSEY